MQFNETKYELSNSLLNCLWLILSHYYLFTISLEAFVLSAFSLQLKSPVVSRKPLQPDNKKHPDDDDSCSVASMYPLKNVAVKSVKFSCQVFLILALVILPFRIWNCYYSLTV